MPPLAWLGLAPAARPAALVALLSNALLSVCWLVLINAASPFVLSTLLHVPAEHTGSITGRLLLADELAALTLYLPAGTLGDVVGAKWVAAAGHAVVAAAFVANVSAESVAQLVAARVLFAIGGGSLVTTLSSMMSSMSAIPVDAEPALDGDEADERTDLLASSARRGSTASTASLRRHEPARMAGVLGFASGLGALLAGKSPSASLLPGIPRADSRTVFGFLRLPTFIARLSDAPDSHEALEGALRRTFHIAAVVAALESAFLAAVLPAKARSASGESRELSRSGAARRLKMAGKRLVEGFRLAGMSDDVALGYAASFASRAQSIVVTAYIPLLVNRYFLDHDLCGPDVSGKPEHDSCRQAFVLASVLTGVIQLLSLLLSPLVGLLSSSTRISASHPQALALACAFLFGAASFLGLALLPREGDPRSSISWLYIVGVGVAQAAGIVLSLALVTTGRGEVVAQEGREVAGALSGAYGLSGGLGILAIGSGAGFLFDRFHGAPFVAVALVDALVAGGAVVLWLRAEV